MIFFKTDTIWNKANLNLEPIVSYDTPSSQSNQYKPFSNLRLNLNRHLIFARDKAAQSTNFLTDSTNPRYRTDHANYTLCDRSKKLIDNINVNCVFASWIFEPKKFKKSRFWTENKKMLDFAKHHF